MLNPLVLIWNRFGLKKENGAAGIRTGVPESPRRRPAVASPLPGRCPAVAPPLPVPFRAVTAFNWEYWNVLARNDPLLRFNRNKFITNQSDKLEKYLCIYIKYIVEWRLIDGISFIFYLVYLISFSIWSNILVDFSPLCHFSLSTSPPLKLYFKFWNWTFASFYAENRLESISHEFNRLKMKREMDKKRKLIAGPQLTVFIMPDRLMRIIIESYR